MEHFFPKQILYRSSTSVRWKKQLPLIGVCVCVVCVVWSDGVEVGRWAFHTHQPSPEESWVSSEPRKISGLDKGTENKLMECDVDYKIHSTKQK